MKKYYTIAIALFIPDLIYAQETNSELEKYIEDARPRVIELYKKTKLPDYKVPLFKLVNRFQGSTIFLDNQKPHTLALSVTMIDIQFMRYSPLFGILRVFLQTPIQASSKEKQLSDPFLKNLNNTSIGISGGGGWYLYDSRKADTGKGTTVLLSFFGFYNIGIANSTIKDNKYTNNGGAELNFRIEQFFYRNLGLVFGTDLGFSNLHYKTVDPHTKKELSLGTMTANYGIVIGLSF